MCDPGDEGSVHGESLVWVGESWFSDVVDPSRFILRDPTGAFKADLVFRTPTFTSETLVLFTYGQVAFYDVFSELQRG